MTETLATLQRVSPLRLRPELTALLKQPTVEKVRALLEAAVKLEHSTIPPYLYALYSLGTAGNQAAAEIIRSVVVQEMLHLNLAANVLNAIGGSPVLDSPAFIPDYPGPLPGMIEHQLTVRLAPCSIGSVQDMFMVIEQPEDPLEFPVAAVDSDEQLTIGQFYRGISDVISALGDRIFTGDPRKQVINAIGGAIRVTDVATARTAINIIVDQGEGTSTSPEEQYGTGFAHYYRFAEIVKGRRLIKNPDYRPPDPPDQKYIYGGEPIPFDPAAVFPVPTDPRNHAPGSLAQRAIDTFNYNYTGLLKTLHAGFNGDPGVIGSAIGAMFSLRQQAIEMMSGQSTDGLAVGPTFRWQPVLGG
ncbi:MAG: ferritin-like domain-containing protein [Trebonia sp.]